MLKKNAEKRFVDYVFLAGLPTDFRINPQKQDEKEDNEEKSSNGEEDLVENEAIDFTEEKVKSRENDTTTKENGNVNITLSKPTLISTESNRSTKSSGSHITIFDNNDCNDCNTSEVANVSRKLLDRLSADLVTNDEESKQLFDSVFDNIVVNIMKFDQERDEFLKSLPKFSTRKSFNEYSNNNDDGNDGSERGSQTKLSENLDELLETNSVISILSNDTSKVQEVSDENRRSYQNVVPQQPSSKQNVIDLDTLSHPLRQKFSPKLLSRYPKNDYPKEGTFPAYIPMFCFPNDIMIRESNTCPTATFHGFVMTQEDGSQQYGVCLTTFEPIPDDLFEELNEQQKIWRDSNMTPSEIEYAEHLNEKIRAESRRLETARAKMLLQEKDISTEELEEIEKEKVDAKEKLELYHELLQPIKLGVLDKNNLWIPKCIGIVSHLPWHDVLKDWLCAVVMPMIEGLKERNDPIKSLVPLERYIINLVHEVPLPPPGKLQVALSVNEITLFCARPALNQSPIMKDFSLYPLFRSLSIKNIITLFEVALAERKILIISSYPDMLSLVAHSIKYLIYPFYWQGVFIPVLPARLMACLQAPVPYIMGIERQYKGIDLLPEDACIVDVDKDTILMAELPVQIPSRQRKKLSQSLETYSSLHTRYSVPFGVPLFIQQAYPNGRFMPVSSKSKMYDKTAGNKIGSVIGAPAKAIPLAPSMNNFFDPENGLMKTNGNLQIDQALHLAPISNVFNNECISSNNSSASSIRDLFNKRGNIGMTVTTTTITTTYNKHVRTSASMGNINLSSNKNYPNFPNTLQRRFSNFVPTSNSFVDKTENIRSEIIRNGNVKNERGLDKIGKLTKQRLSTITGGARNSIMTFKKKALVGNNVFSIKRNLNSRSVNPNSNSIISPPQSPTSPNSTVFSFSDDISSTICSDESRDKFIPGMNLEKNYESKEGHLMLLLPPDDEAYGQKSGINTWMMEGLACGVCRNSLGINPVYKCDGCSMMIHHECLTDVVYPCMPACFDESKILESFLKVFSSLLRNYRDFILDKNGYANDLIEDEIDALEEDNNELFKKDAFLKTVNKDTKEFLSELVDSQSFSQFIAERTTSKFEDYDTLYFDEVIKAKLNRSKLKLSKETTNFLNDPTFDVSQTIRAMKPNEEGLDELGFEGYVCLPDCFDSELMIAPRPIRNGRANGFGKGWR